mmetsp:Transcript_35142/g.86400  ORF Transcript_35142/g.86400 Transcript_35142/m.86400 type:complete len:286 (-) Transcript_35142:1257-2114(-)
MKNRYFTMKITNSTRIAHHFFSIFFILVFFFSLFFTRNFNKERVFEAKVADAYLFSEQPPLAKLKSIPVFSVTNRTGAPFLIQNKKGEQVGLIFFSYREAIDFSKEMLKAHQAKKPYIYIMNLEKAFKMVNLGPTLSGLKDNYGMDHKMRFQFVPEKKQLNYATRLAKKRGITEKIPLIPVFTVDGLTLNKGKEKISPIFFAKEDLISVWNKVRKNDPSLHKKPQIIEGDFIQLFLFMKADYKNEENFQKYFNFGFVPSSKNKDFVKIESINGPLARMVEFKKVF